MGADYVLIVTLTCVGFDDVFKTQGTGYDTSRAEMRQSVGQEVRFLGRRCMNPTSGVV